MICSAVSCLSLRFTVELGQSAVDTSGARSFPGNCEPNERLPVESDPPPKTVQHQDMLTARTFKLVLFSFLQAVKSCILRFTQKSHIM